MDWEQMRRQWQRQAPAEAQASVAELQQRDRKLERQVRRRDWLETGAAVLVALFFGVLAFKLAARGLWPAFGFALLLVLWAGYVPLRLHGARHLAREPSPQLPLIGLLARQRDAALAQARMLEQAWLWYVAPVVTGTIGLGFLLGRSRHFALGYAVAVLALGAFLVWINRRAARTVFRAHAQELQREIDELSAESDA